MPEANSKPDPLPNRKIVVESVFRQVVDACRDAVVSGGYVPGDRFPSERELADRFGVSRPTANKAIAALVSEKLLELRPGLGAFVRRFETLQASLREMKSFTEQSRALGLEPETRVVKFATRSAKRLPAEVADALALDHHVERVFFCERVRIADGVPLILEQRWVREDCTPDLMKADLEGSFYRLLEEKYGIRMTGESHTISAVNLDDDSAARLDVQSGSAALLVKGAGFQGARSPIWYQRLLYRGDRYSLQNDVQGGADGVQIKVMFRQETEPQPCQLQ